MKRREGFDGCTGTPYIDFNVEPSDFRSDNDRRLGVGTFRFKQLERRLNILDTYGGFITAAGRPTSEASARRRIRHILHTPGKLQKLVPSYL